jgi:peroxiredoxin (alkyl hydroperoxide reductase subunit C)
LFIINPEGILQYAVVHDLNIGRSVDETLRVLQGLQTGGLCAADWKPGQSNLKV